MSLGFAHSLCMGLFHKWQPKRLFVFFTVYIDESGTHGPSPTTIMAGYVARAGQWSVFEPKWRGMLRKRGLTHWHTKHVVRGEGECKGWPWHKRGAAMKRATKIIGQHTLFGFVAVLSNADYEKYYIAGERPRKWPLDSKYGLCFRLCLSFLPEALLRFTQRDTARLTVILESGHKNAGDIDRIIEQYRKYGPRKYVDMVDFAGFAPKRKTLELQAADYAAYGGTLIERDQEIPISNYDREKMHELPKSEHMFRLPATEAVLRQLKGNVISAIAARKEYWEKGRRS